MLIQIALSSLIIPKSQDIARSFLRTSKVNFYGNFIKPQRFNDTIKDVTIYSEKKDIMGNLYNLYLKKEIDPDNFQITFAKKGEFKEYNNIPVLVLYDGATITGKDNDITNFSFSKSDFPLSNFETNTTTYKKTQELNSINLIKCVNYLYTVEKQTNTNIKNCSKKNLNNINREIYKRFIIPFYIPLLTLIPFMLILSSKENINYQKIKVVTFLLGLFFIIFSETTIKIISTTILNNFVISLIPIFSIIIIYSIYFKKTNYNLLIK